MKWHQIKLLIIILFFSTGTVAQKSNEDNFAPVQNSPSGNFLFLKDGNSSLNAKTVFTIWRAAKGSDQFTEIGNFSTVQSYAAFKKIAGESIAAEFKARLKAKSDDEVIAYLNKPRDIKDYGLFISDIHFLEAIGLVYLDVVPSSDAFKYEYKVTDPSGRVLYRQAAKAFDKNSIPRPLVKKIYTTDSVVSIRWEFPPFKTSIPLLAKIYRQNDGIGKYMAYPGNIAVIQNENEIYVMHEEPMAPDHLVNYFIVPVDMMGNEGNHSDTATAITINFKKAGGIVDITVTDSMGGLFSQWKPLPAKPYYTGIQILRSRDATKDFVVLDTVSAEAVQYLDKRVLPNVTYFYKFRPLVYKLSGWKEVIATTVHGSTKSSQTPPLKPNNLAVFNEGENIRLTWNYNTELDIFAYYVLRGTSSKNMEIVSGAVMDTTWLDSTVSLSGRTNYLYSVLAMNNSQLKSEPSAIVGIKPLRKGFVQSPAGISLHTEGKKVILTWMDVRRNDPAIAGYILYREKSTEKEFTPVIQKLIADAYYEDVLTEASGEYSYTVSAVDYFGNISEPSPSSKINLNAEKPLPPSQFFVRKLSTSVEISWPNNNSNSAAFYTIYRRLPDDKNYQKIGTTKPGDVIFIDKKFAPNKLNVYAISISINDNESEKSVEKTLFIEK